MSDKIENKVYPVVGYVEVGMYRLRVRFFSEKDEQKTRLAAQTIKSKLKELAEGYDDSINECTAMLLLQLMIENTDLKSELEYSVDRVTLQKIDDILESVNEDSLKDIGK